MMTITMGCLAGHSACGHVCSLAPTPASGTALVPAGGLLFQRAVQCSGKVARVGATGSFLALPRSHRQKLSFRKGLARSPGLWRPHI